MISSVVEHNQVIQGSHVHQGSDNYKGAGAPFSQREYQAHQGSDNWKRAGASFSPERENHVNQISNNQNSQTNQLPKQLNREVEGMNTD